MNFSTLQGGFHGGVLSSVSFFVEMNSDLSLSQWNTSYQVLCSVVLLCPPLSWSVRDPNGPIETMKMAK